MTSVMSSVAKNVDILTTGLCSIHLFW